MFPFYTNLQLLLRLAYLQHKWMGLVLRLGQVSLNSENVQKLAVFHGFIKTSLFPFYTNLQLLLRLAYLQHKWIGLDLRLGQVSRILRTFESQLFYTVLSKKVYFPFMLTCSYQCTQQIYNTNAWVQTNVWVKFRQILKTFKIQLFCTILLKQVCFTFILVVSINLSKFTTQMDGSGLAIGSSFVEL